jgi:hypothetical protein
MGRSVYLVKWFTTEWQKFRTWRRVWNGGAEVAEALDKRLLCCGFRRTGKAMGQVYQFWLRICREINVFSMFEYHVFYVLYPFVTHLLTLSRTVPVKNSTEDLFKFLLFMYYVRFKTPTRRWHYCMLKDLRYSRHLAVTYRGISRFSLAGNNLFLIFILYSISSFPLVFSYLYPINCLILHLFPVFRCCFFFISYFTTLSIFTLYTV